MDTIALPVFISTLAILESSFFISPRSQEEFTVRETDTSLVATMSIETLCFEKTEKTSARNPYCPNILEETISTRVTSLREVIARTGGLFLVSAFSSIFVPAVWFSLS
jgi:hypothetical protein